jgi:tetratricopeptide (TPR) repeat protein
MTKWIVFGLLGVAVVVSWVVFSAPSDQVVALEREIAAEQAEGDPDERVPMLKVELKSLEDSKTFTGILLAFVTAGVVGIFFVMQVLPVLAHRMTHAVYDSGEMVEADPMHDARSLVAQGEYEAAIESFRAAAAADRLNRLPYVEISKIQRSHLDDPQAAIQTIRQALESQEWQENDAAYFMFRLAELYDEDTHDRDSAVSILYQVMQQFPETRHSANARHKLHEWGLV